MADTNNTLLMALIKGLKYNDKTEEYTFKHKKYRLREVKETEKKSQEVHYYFVNINEPTDLKIIKAIGGIPTYDGFNDVRVDSTLRKIAYQREYYKRVTVEKRAKAGKSEKEKTKTKKKSVAKKKKVLKPKKCAFCGTEFTPKQTKQKFCCRKCQMRYNSKKQADKIKEENKIEKVCPICNKTFEGTPRQIYCSKDCYKLSQKDNRRQRYLREKEVKNSDKKVIVAKKKNVK